MTYDWKRYWVPRDGTFSYDQKGFLLPVTGDAQWSKLWKTDIVNFDEINKKPCLILLGEPGIGKSFALRDSEAQAKVTLQNSNARFLSRNLGIYGSDSYLIADIFDSPEFKWWENGGGELHVFLDSFDECLFRVDSLAALLADRFTKLSDTKNLFLRIASRTAEWRTSLEDALRNKWNEELMGVYELAPLTRDQVLLAADKQALEAEKFVNAVTTNEVVPFAIKPLTLDLLFRIWRKQGGALPPTQSEIYEQGCLELCTEDSDRETPKLRRKFTSEERLGIASHIAAAMMFSKRSSIHADSRSDVLDADITINELAESFVMIKARELPITEAALKETLDTGLFTSRGRGRMGWAHQTYAEFLAARYLNSQGLNTKQVLDLLTHPHDPEHKLVPQLQETAAWVAGSNKDVFNHLTQIQPDVLLRSDVATADTKSKALLIESLLSFIGRDYIHGDWWQMRDRYRKLNYAGLAAQLRKYFSAQNLTEDTRLEAVRIAGECQITELLDNFIRLAVNPNEVKKIREWAAIYADRMSSEKEKSRLKPLALGQCGQDADDALRGIGLTACWPNHLSAREVFNSLKKPNGFNINLYSHFFDRKLIEGLKKADLIIALEWVEKQESSSYPESFSIAISGIMKKAESYLDDVLICNTYARVLLSRFRKHDHYASSGLSEYLLSNTAQRLRLVKIMALLFEDDRLDALTMTRRGLGLVIPEDFSWLLEQLQSAESPALKRNFCQIISFVFNPDSSHKVDLLIKVAQEQPILSEIMAFWLKTVDLDSEITRKTRELHLKHKQYMEEVETRKTPQLLSPSPAEQITILLGQFEHGDIDAWWKMTCWIEIGDDGNYAKHSSNMDIRELPYWANASENTKTRLLAAAYRYVCEGDSRTEEWFSKKNVTYHPAVAGFRALLLLENESSNLAETIPKAAWCKWIPIILKQHNYDELAAHRLLAGKIFKLAPIESIDWLVQVINLENRESGHLWVLQKLPEKWSDALSDTLLGCLKHGKLQPQCVNDLLVKLIKQNAVGAMEFARSLIPRQPPKRKKRYKIALSAARLLILHGEYSDWLKVKQLFQKEPKFGRDLFEGFSHDYEHAPAEILKALSASDVAQLWEWILAEYPLETDPDLGRGGTVTTRHSMANLRNNLISYLANLGTESACEALYNLSKKHPKLEFLRWQLSRAREQTRRKTWQPSKPSEIFRLAENKNRRLVQSADQLMQVVLDSFMRFQDKLQGKTPLANLLWADGRPKHEKDLSDWLEDILNNDLKGQGIIVGREVQIHRLDRLDLRIDAIARQHSQAGFDTVQLIIEVKGCWNRELKEAMQSQLVNRYLAKNDCQHGLYVVGWFLCAAWVGKNPSRGSVKFSNKEDIIRFLENQANTLSVNGKSVASIVLDATIPTPKKLSHRKISKSVLKRNR